MLGPLALAGVLAAAPPGASDPHAPVLVWRAPPGCPREAELRAQVDALLADAPAGVGRDMTIDLRVAPLPGGRWRLDATMRGPGVEGRRDLEAERCSELVEAAALLTAIALYPELGGASDPPAAVVPAAPPAPRGPVAPTEPATPAAASSAPSDMSPETFSKAPESHAPSDMSMEPPRERVPHPPPALYWPLALAAGPGFAVLPGVSAVLRVSAGVRGPRWSVALSQTFWLPRDLPAPADPTVGGRVWLWAAGARGCGIPRPGRVELALCGGIEAGVLTGRGTGALEPARRVTSAWAAASVGPVLRVRLTRRLAFNFGVDLLAMLAYPRLQVPGRGIVCCGARVGALASAGLELRFRHHARRQ